MFAPGTTAIGRSTQAAHCPRNGAPMRAFGRRPVTNSDLLSVSTHSAMRRLARSGVLVA